MATADFAAVESSLHQLSPAEKRRLMTLLTEQLTIATADRESCLVEMAADPEIRRELEAIEHEFSQTLGDGLEDA